MVFQSNNGRSTRNESRRDDTQFENQQNGSITFITKEQKEQLKKKDKLNKKLNREVTKLIAEMDLNDREHVDVKLNALRLEQKPRDELENFVPYFMSNYRVPMNLPNVYDAYQSTSFSDFSVGSSKLALPEGTERKIRTNYHEVIVPAQKRIAGADLNVQPIMISSLDPSGFAGIEKLNLIQSIVFEQAYNSLENLLICAPTGAGKTNIAMLAVLKTIRDYCDEHGNIKKNEFKIVYIAPMKALATEITRTFSKRLSKLGLRVKEWTGDTQLTKKEIHETQMFVLTPEKWDVVTRKVEEIPQDNVDGPKKPGATKKKTEDTALSLLVRLLIIDEVHLLHDERGPVIETIVARTLRQMERYHVEVRIVGLSATLPNYPDVAQFLGVDLEKGLFFFDGRFRPIPLTQIFIGVIKPNLGTTKENMDLACYEKCLEFVRDDHQVLIFVHSRVATTQIATYLLQRAAIDNNVENFKSSSATRPEYTIAMKRVNSARDDQTRRLARRGVGVHHAGMIRHDRHLMEKLFADGHIKVLCCTATLAWGVNLPAHAVIIRGTDVFDQTRGVFEDLGILDVQQIFGRAGRPQFESSGHGIIITPMKTLFKYVSMLTRQAPIESCFYQKVHDNLNAEVVRGTVKTIDAAIDWIRYTYFFIRARLNPLHYGIDRLEAREDPTLHRFLMDICYGTARKLDACRMIHFDIETGNLSSTELGGIAARYYLTYETVETFQNEDTVYKFAPEMDDELIFALICSATEFSKIQSHEEEMRDMDQLVSGGCGLPIRGGGIATSQGKANCLLQAFISRAQVNHPALFLEMMEIAQNAARVSQALFEMALHEKWAHTTIHCHNITKYIQRRVWSYNSPLRQVIDAKLLDFKTVQSVESRRYQFFDLLDFDAQQLGKMFNCDGQRLYESVEMLPSLEIYNQKIKAIPCTGIRITADIIPAFKWNNKFLGSDTHQRFLLFVENVDTNRILHHEWLSFMQKDVNAEKIRKISLTIPMEDTQMRNHFQIRISSADWVVQDTIIPLSIQS